MNPTSFFTNVLSGAGNAVNSASNFIGGLFRGGSSSQSTPQSGSGNNPGEVFNAIKRDFANLTSNSSSNPYSDEVSKLEKELLELQKRQASAVPPPINTAQIQSQARKQAKGNVNPYYNRLLNQFKKNQARKKTQAVEGRTRDISRIDEALQLALELSDTSRQRTAEDVEANLGEITAQDEFNQQTEGTEFDRARRALAGETAEAGLTTSGIGQQREAEAVSDRNVLAKEEARRVNVQKQAQETFRTRTFQDLERADKGAEREAEIGKEDVQVDFDSYIKDLAYDTKTGIQTIQEQRQSRLASETQDLARKKTLQFIENIQDPYARAAAYNAYGGLF